MVFKVAMILDEVTDWDVIKKGLGKLGVEFWMKDCKTEEDLIMASQGADFIITLASKYPYTHNVLGKMQSCRFIETLGVGYDGLDVKVATENGIGIINNTDYPIEELSDHTMSLILACARRVVELNNTVKNSYGNTSSEIKRKLPQIWAEMSRLKGKTLGLIGFGRIAKAVSRKAKVFGMDIVSYDPYISEEDMENLNVQKCSLEHLIKTADFISVHAILTSDTRHLIGLEQFKQMKPGAFIINTARGAIIDEKSLNNALDSKLIAGAALDVTDPEPPAPDNPLLKRYNVILTGHSGHSSPESWEHRLNRPLEEIVRVMRGEWPIGLVNHQVKIKYEQKWGKMSVEK